LGALRSRLTYFQDPLEQVIATYRHTLFIHMHGVLVSTFGRQREHLLGCCGAELGFTQVRIPEPQTLFPQNISCSAQHEFCGHANFLFNYSCKILPKSNGVISSNPSCNINTISCNTTMKSISGLYPQTRA
jgi:hypothetical protein